MVQLQNQNVLSYVEAGTTSATSSSLLQQNHHALPLAGIESSAEVGASSANFPTASSSPIQSQLPNAQQPSFQPQQNSRLLPPVQPRSNFAPSAMYSGGAGPSSTSSSMYFGIVGSSSSYSSVHSGRAGIIRPSSTSSMTSGGAGPRPTNFQMPSGEAGSNSAVSSSQKQQNDHLLQSIGTRESSGNTRLRQEPDNEEFMGKSSSVTQKDENNY